METVVYLIRHSVRMKGEMIDTYNTLQSDLLKNEKIILSVSGEKRAEILSREEELQNIDVLYTSNCVRTLQTAKYMMESQNLKANIDSRFDERRVGTDFSLNVSDWFILQYTDSNFRPLGGECQEEVRNRMYEALEEVVSANKGKRIAIFSHGLAITFLLLKWCHLDSVSLDRKLVFSFKGREVFNKRINSPDVFKLVFDEENNVLSIENIGFSDLDYEDFVNL